MAINAVVSPKRLSLARALCMAVKKKANPSRVTTAKDSLREEPLFVTEAPRRFKPNVRFHRSVVVPVPSQSTTHDAGIYI